MSLQKNTVLGFGRLFILCWGIFYTSIAYAQTRTYVKGRVTDIDGNPMAFSSVYVKNSTYGVNTNLKGNYFLELKPGAHTLVYHFLGYKPIEKQIVLEKGAPQTIHVKLQPTATNIGEVEVFLKPKKEGRRIVRLAIEKRRDYLTAVNSYQCNTYLKSSLKKETPQELMLPDSLIESIQNEALRADMKKFLGNQKLNLIESVSEIYYKAPGRYKEIIKGHHDYAEKDGERENFSLSISYSSNDIIPSQNVEHNPYILYKDITSGDFNFYKNSIQFPAVCQKPILSPIASTAMLSYNYRYDMSFKDTTGRKIYKIEVIPRIKTEALFAGYIYIEDSTWALKSVDLSINETAMYMSQHFQVIQNYELIDDKYYLPVRREFSYTLKDGFFLVMGNTRVHHKDYQVNIDFPNGHFGNEVIRFEDDAFDKDSAFWDKERPIQLEEDELEYIEKVDSIEDYYTSDEYYAKIDSQFNEINWWSLLNGVGHRNRKKGTEWWINGLIDQPNFFGIGGYRHKLGGNFSYDLRENKDKDLKLEADGFVDYGFRNRDVKGELGVGINYKQLKFMRTYVRVGDVYEMINNYESIEATFSRSNYVRKQTFMVSQRMEIVNGLFAEASFNFSDQIPLTGLEFANWSNWLFGDLNDARPFMRYKKSEVKLELRFKPMQKYIIKKGRKILLDTKYPEFALEYRRGIPGLLNSEVNYDYLELSARDDIKLKRFGSSRWQVSTGTYLNEDDLRLLEYKFFRGSDLFIFSDPIFSFQHLPTTYATNKEWFSANYIHHFEGSIISKVPILNKMKFQLAAGAGTLAVTQPGTDLAHVEVFAGLERPFKIKKDLFRWGIYMVSSTSTINPGVASNLKLGITYFDPINKKWGY